MGEYFDAAVQRSVQRTMDVKDRGFIPRQAVKVINLLDKQKALNDDAFVYCIGFTPSQWCKGIYHTAEKEISNGAARTERIYKAATDP